MKRSRLVFLFVLLVLFASCSRVGVSAPASIRVASYNMEILGPAKEARTEVFSAMARIAAGFDLMAMQEVGSNSSRASDESCVEVMDAFVAKVDEAAGGAIYAYVRGGQFAFLYRKDRLEAKSWRPYDGAEKFAYAPLEAYFQVIGRPFNFTAVTVHTKPSFAAAEIPEIAGVMEEAAAASSDPDVLCLGDFNAGGEYYDEGPGLDLAGFPSSRFFTVIPNNADTTVGKKALAYDRIELSSSMATDYAGTWGIVHPEELSLSDHYPVWADFSTTCASD